MASQTMRYFHGSPNTVYPVFMFTRAITRFPCSRFAEGITTSSRLGPPDFSLALRQHRSYTEALQHCGLTVEVLPAEEQFPDSCFVEDTAVITEEIAVITRPGAPSRMGETAAMATLLANYRKLAFIQKPGTLEGGDVMQIGNHFFAGITARTNQEGVRQLAEILVPYQYRVIPVAVKDVLHLKTAVNYLGNGVLLVTREFLHHPVFRDWEKIEIPESEVYAANCLELNGTLVMPAGFPTVKSKLHQRGFSLLEVEMSEFEKMDGGLSCLSLRFR